MIRGLAVLVLLARAAAARADEGTTSLLRQAGVDQRLDAEVPLDLRFRDEEGRAVTLGDYVRDRPVIVTPVYYRCPMLCGEVLNGLTSALGVLPFTVGKEFTVVTVSFDPRETPVAAAEKKALYLKRYGRSGAAAGWHFLTGDADAIARLTAALGFRYAYDAALDQYAHGAAIAVLTPQGRISRYFFGVEFAPRDLRLGLVEASANRIGSLTDQLLLFCYHYDPATGKYGALVMRLVRAGGILTVLALGTFIVVMRRRERAAS
jgi:protein SCO1/2